jgi:hypothetical protein
LNVERFDRQSRMKMDGWKASGYHRTHKAGNIPKKWLDGVAGFR